MRDPDRDAKAVVDGYDDRIHPVRLDVTDPAGTAACVAEAVRRFGRIDALVNNAGYGLFGAQEDLSDAEARRQFDTNLLGQWRMVRAVAPHLRGQRYGKIVNVSSLSGRVPSPLLSCYAATKHAIEAMSEGLAGELVAWGVQVTILEPGMYASDWQTTNLDVCEKVRTGASAYGPATDRAVGGFRALAATRPGSDAVAAAIADIVQLQQPLPLRWPVGEDCLRMITRPAPRHRRRVGSADARRRLGFPPRRRLLSRTDVPQPGMRGTSRTSWRWGRGGVSGGRRRPRPAPVSTNGPDGEPRRRNSSSRSAARCASSSETVYAPDGATPVVNGAHSSSNVA